MKHIFVALISTVVISGACAPDGRPDGEGEGSGSGSGEEFGDPTRCTKMDIVFVVDNSGSMAEEQGNLATNFPMFADTLLNYLNGDGYPIDFRVALTTTGKTVTTVITTNLGGMPITQTLNEVGDDGKFKTGCNVNRNYLDPLDPGLGQALACRANVGTSGPGTEMPLVATKLALTDRITDGSNAGFVRDDALLGIVMLTDEDDSSTEMDEIHITVDFSNPTGATPTTDFNPTDLINFLDTFKGHRSRWAAGAIAGQQACTSAFGDATAAPRLQDFINQAGTQGVFSSICAGDLTVGLTQILDKFQSACGGIIL